MVLSIQNLLADTLLLLTLLLGADAIAFPSFAGGYKATQKI